MHANPERRDDGAPRCTLNGVKLGMRLTLPLLPGVIAFAGAFGTAAAQKGVSAFEAVLMSALVFAGASQLVALQVWAEPLTATLVLALVGVVSAVNMRLVLMGAALRPWMGSMPARESYSILSTLTDANWLVAMRHREEGGSDVGVLLGSGLLLWAVWTAATLPGHLLGGLIAEPDRFGLDLVMPAFFTAMLVPLWKGSRQTFVWTVAGVVAVLTALLVDGYWFIVVGALAGSLAGAFADE